jgi:hypothetical protein
MAVNHMVWMKFKPGVSAATIASILDGLKALEKQVPGIVSLTLGSNFTDRAQGYTHGMMVILKDKEALPAYQAHPAHAAAGGRLREHADILAMDYEF